MDRRKFIKICAAGLVVGPGIAEQLAEATKLGIPTCDLIHIQMKVKWNNGDFIFELHQEDRVIFSNKTIQEHYQQVAPNINGWADIQYHFSRTPRQVKVDKWVNGSKSYIIAKGFPGKFNPERRIEPWLILDSKNDGLADMRVDFLRMEIRR